MKFHLTKFNVGDRVIMANNKYGEQVPDVGTVGVIDKIYTYASTVRPGETLYKIAWQEASGEFWYWNIAESALALEKEWEGKKPVKKER